MERWARIVDIPDGVFLCRFFLFSVGQPSQCQLAGCRTAQHSTAQNPGSQKRHCDATGYRGDEAGLQRGRMLKGATTVSSLRGQVADAAGCVWVVWALWALWRALALLYSSLAHGLNQHSGHRRSGKLGAAWAGNLTCINSETVCVVSLVFLVSRDLILCRG